MEYKLSHYTILSEPVNTANDFVLFSTRTGRAIVLSAKVRQKLESGSIELLPQNIKEQLILDQCIVLKNENEIETITRENKEEVILTNTLYEVIQPSAMCQLGCDYCGQDHQKKYFKTTLFDKLIERIRNKAAAGSYEYLSIGWFGGEPLMALQQIRTLTPMLKAVAKEFGLQYTSNIVTNGLSLKEAIFVELATDLGIRSVEITLDGTSEFHDKRRHTKEGGASFDLIFKNLLNICDRPDFKELDCSISIRCNVDHRNYEGVSPLIKKLAHHNLQKKISYFYPIGVYSWGGNSAHEKSLSKEEYAEMEIEWLIEMIQNGFPTYLLPSRQKEICIAVSKSSEMYDPYGNIFNCTEVSLTSVYDNKPYALGNLAIDHLSFADRKPLNDWNDVLLTDRFPCHSCKMLPVCGGGCPKSWYEDMRACPAPKFNIKERLLLSYIVSNGNVLDTIS